MKSITLFIFAVLAFGMVGCRANLQVERSADGGVDVTATISEQDVNAAVADALAQSNPLLRNPQVDLQPGQIVIMVTKGMESVDGKLQILPDVLHDHLPPSIRDQVKYAA
ncbi:MAG: hypothetical protein JNM70_17510, partial [Anaerolineae bacterium]|nr:hypothetical protein [Anaerolineae bacterium]